MTDYVRYVRAWSPSSKKMVIFAFEFDEAVKVTRPTGCTDKYGQDIHEGDIIGVSGRGVEGIVQWSNVQGGFIIDVTVRGDISSLYESHLEFSCFTPSTEFEILGNKFENDNLLEKESA